MSNRTPETRPPSEPPRRSEHERRVTQGGSVGERLGERGAGQNDEESEESDEGLVRLGESRRARPGSRALAVFFLLVLAGTALVDRVWPVEPVRVYGMEGRRAPIERKFEDGSLARVIERWIGNRSRVKRITQSVYAAALLRGIGETRDSLVPGRDGWLFLRDRLGDQPISTQRAVDLTAFMVSTVARRVRAAGVRCLVLPIPRKAVLDAEYLPDSVRTRSDLDRRVIDGLLACGVEAVDLLAVFEEEMASEPSYSRRDSHWTYETRLRVARLLADRLAPGAEANPTTRLVGPFEGDENLDLLRFLGMQPEIVRPLLDMRKTLFHRVVPRGAGGVVESVVPEAAGVVWLVGTSFSADDEFPAFIGHFANARVLNLSRGGAEPVTLAARAFRTRSERPDPTALVFEFPLHMSLEEGIFRRAMLEVGSLRIGERALDLELPGVLSRLPGWNEPHSLDGHFTTLVALEEGRVARFADAAVTLRLRRAARGETLLIGTRSAAGVVWTRWPAAQEVLDLPIPGARGRAERVDVLATRNGDRPSTLELRTCRLLLDVDPDTAVEGTPSPPARVAVPVLGPAAEGPGWSQQVEFDPPVRTEAGGEFVLEVRTGQDERRSFEVVAVDSRGFPSAPLHVRGVMRFGQVVLPDSGLGASEVRTLLLRGSGTPPSAFVYRARHCYR